MRLLAMAAIAIFAASSVGPQQKNGQTGAQSTQQVLAAQAKTIADLAEQVKELQSHIQTLEPREQQRSLVTYGNAAKLDFSEVKLDLAGFERGCESEHDRAVAMAMAEKAPVLTYMGGAAMNCTERVKKILDKLVDTLDKQP